MTTHLMEEAEHCDRLAILNKGRLVALGSPAQLKSAIGGDVVLFETATPEAARSLVERMGDRFGSAAERIGQHCPAGAPGRPSPGDHGGGSFSGRNRRYLGGSSLVWRMCSFNVLAIASGADAREKE